MTQTIKKGTRVYLTPGAHHLSDGSILVVSGGRFQSTVVAHDEPFDGLLHVWMVLPSSGGRQSFHLVSLDEVTTEPPS